MQIIFISIYKEKRDMTLHGKFIINDADYSPLEFDGVEFLRLFSVTCIQKQRSMWHHS